MKLKLIKKSLLGLFLINSLVACKFNGEFIKVAEDTYSANLEVQDQKLDAQVESYEVKDEQLKLTVRTSSPVKNISAQLDNLICDERGLQNICYADLLVEGDLLEDNSAGNNQAIIYLSLANIMASELHITDSSGSITYALLEEEVSEEIFEGIKLKSVSVDESQQSFTVIAEHQLCKAGNIDLNVHELELFDPAPISDQEPIGLHDSSIEPNKLLDSSDNETLPQLITPVWNEPKIAYLVFKTNSEPVACPTVVDYSVTVKRTFSFDELGVKQGSSLTIYDSRGKRLRVVRPIPDVQPVLGNIFKLDVDTERAQLVISTHSFLRSKIEIETCFAGNDRSAYVGVSSRCVAHFLQTLITIQSVSQRAPLVQHRYDFEEVGLKTKNSSLILKHAEGFYSINIDSNGKAQVVQALN